MPGTEACLKCNCILAGLAAGGCEMKNEMSAPPSALAAGSSDNVPTLKNGVSRPCIPCGLKIDLRLSCSVASVLAEDLPACQVIGGPMGKDFDVVVVGGRCAGSPLAALLVRAGLSVALVEQATFPRDTLSTHIFESAALAFLKRLGVLSAVRATGAPIVNRVDIRQEGFRAQVPAPQQPGDVGGATSVRRLRLDPILMEAAAAAGAEVWMGAKVTALVRDRGRVTGVRVARDGSEQALEARLVVGADGRNSTVARLAGARKYNLTPNERFAYWSFFEGADPGPEPTVVFHRWSGNLVLGIPTDSGLYQVLALPGLSELPRFRQNLEESYLEYVRRCDPVAHALSGARRVGKLFGMLRWEGFFREATGPGWVLAGDAGHFKDPAPGQGIQDAFRQVESLAPAIIGAINRSPSALDEALAGWARWRDEDAGEHYWLAADLGKACPAPAVLPEIAQRLYERGKLDSFLDLFNHRSAPSKVLTPPRLAGATARLLTRGGCDRRALMGEVGALVAEDVRRKRLARHPHYVPLETSVDAGLTEVDDNDAARSELSTSTLEVFVCGVRSRVLTAGPPDGAEAVVFVHGNPGPADDWRDLLARAGELGRAIAPDMPGYGRPASRRTSAIRWTATPATWRRCSISSGSPACISSRTTSGARGPWRGPRAILAPLPAPRSSTPAC